MAREIIVLETNPSDGGYISVVAVFWFAIAAGAQVNVAPFRSAVNPTLAGAAAVTAAEQSALDSGAVKEEAGAYRFPASFTTAQIKAELQAAYASRQQYIASTPNKIQYYGVSWDGTAWSA